MLPSYTWLVGLFVSAATLSDPDAQLTVLQRVLQAFAAWILLQRLHDGIAASRRLVALPTNTQGVSACNPIQQQPRTPRSLSRPHLMSRLMSVFLSRFVFVVLLAACTTCAVSALPIVSTIAGDVTLNGGPPNNFGHANGAGTSASFNGPPSVAVDAQGTVAVVVRAGEKCGGKE